MVIVTLGIDLAKNVFAVHGVDATGRACLVRPRIARGKLLELIASLRPCLIGMETCSVMRADAAAICEAVTRTATI
jgi:transposase